MKEAILNLLQEKEYNPLSAIDIFELLPYESSTDFKEFMKTLLQLEEEGIVFETKKHKYILASRANLLQGVFKVNHKGFGFVIMENDDDIFVVRSNFQEAINGDVVLVEVLNHEGLRREGRIVKVLKKGNTFFVGTYHEKKSHGYVLLDDPKMGLKIDISHEQRDLAVNGSKVCVILLDKKNDEVYNGKIIKVIGHRNDPGIDILSTIYKHDIEVEFNEKVLEEIAVIPNEVREKDLVDRVDLRDEVIVTIDGDDAKDLDDAISLVKTSDRYILKVHIADVSYYVEEATNLDKSAASRATSVYLVDRVIPMLPHYLSNNICSLNEGEDRLAMTCEMHFNYKGELVDHKLYASVIHSKARMTYNNVNRILNDDLKGLEHYENLYELFFLMHELALKIRQKRIERGSLDFDVPEGKIILDSNGKVSDVVVAKRFEAERIIEDFMIVANETVAEHFYWLDLPFVYRVHAKPKDSKMEKFIRAANANGFSVKRSSEKISHHSLQNILKELDDDKGYVMRTLLLRSMQKAIYDTKNIGHFGLASKYYTHFTSPIRRYPDLLVHRLIRKYEFLGNLNFSNNDIGQLVQNSEHSSFKERKAMDCEYEILDMKKAEYMEQFIGSNFKGIISSLTNFGMFVELENTIEGLIRFADITSDHFIYDEERMLVYSKKSNKVYKLGEEVKVKLVRADKITGEIDFILR